ncbi:hypothetical protein [Pandoraea pulmonicola]|uniref:Uncharacterized protein n=1 Tax=Pandoraea pulmonicola TaxID=93221 RepID=A0AAJ5D343_PANPU|nr:hypothetical protein [Pandoraea pulmonicola]SUD95622.1 Uncharacterised protein [Pandoraea pulmonicola]
MSCCPLAGLMRLRDPQDRYAAHARTPSLTLFRLMEALAERLRWYGLMDLLSAIPDSNEDFIVF